VLRYLAKRLLLLIPVALGVAFLAFLLIHLVPGDPARTFLGSHSTPAGIRSLDHAWGLDRPLPVQYWLFLDRLLHGDLGQSLFYQASVNTLIASRLPATLLLLVYATILSLLISVPIALLAAVRRNSWVDQTARAIPVVGIGMPSFWLGIMLILVFALRLRLFPVGGYGQDTLHHLWSMFLPGLTVALAISPMLIRSLRASLIEALDSDYVAFARSKGLPGWIVLLRYGLRNASISGVTILGINIGFLVGGTLVVENVFAVPGLGSLMVQSIMNRDFPVVQGITIVFAVIVIVVYLLTDLAYAALDPRVQFS
jgi:peptide/nickel transport system permease protein